MLIALTGSTGFIGQHLVRELPRRGYRLRVLLRRPTSLPTNTASAVIGDIARPQNMSAALQDVDAVIHSAGLAQAMSGVPEDDYRVINTEATINLARAARRAGAKRFIFLSSIRAQCGPTADTVLTEALEPSPTDAYGRSKLAAERGLAELDIDWVSLRAALVYGPGVKGNMAQLMRLARSPLPLPLGGLRARRSLLAVENLLAAIETVLGDTRDAAAAFHCRRSAGVDGRGNDRSHAPWTWSLAECFLVSRDAARAFVSRRRARARCTSGFPVRSSSIPPP